MSVASVQAWAARLPYNLQEQVVGYARSVESALPEIQAEAGVELRANERDTLVLLAGLRKLYSLVYSSYWAIENTGSILSHLGSTQIRSGGTFYSPGSELYIGLRIALEEMQGIIRESEVDERTLMGPYDRLARIIVDGR